MVANTGTIALAPAPARPIPVATLVLCAWAVTAALLAAKGWAATAETLHDTDDAMRLVAVRALLEGRGWFDLTEPRVVPGGYDSHWSRLIDAGIAGLVLALRTVFDPALAERLARVLWPLALLLPAMAASTLMAARLAGRDGALVALVLLVQALPAYQQFVPGRIDHHNVQITFVLLTMAAAMWADRVPIAGALAGAATALGLAVGLEGMPFLAAAGAGLALRFVLDGKAGTALTGYAAALAGGTVLVVAAGLAPVWSRPIACDALALNGAAAVVLAALGVFAAARFAPALPWAGRLGAVGLAAGLGVVVGLVLEPRCAGGPFAMLDPAVRAGWLVQVQEMQPLPAVIRDDPAMGLAFAAFPAVTLIALAVLARCQSARGSALWLLAGSFGLALVLSLATIKTTGYAVWLGIPAVAALVLTLAQRLGQDTRPVRIGLAFLLSPSVAALASAAVGRVIEEPAGPSPADACFRSAAYAPLAALPPGVVAAHVDFGPHILAHTGHAVLGAPYHRIDQSIATLLALFAVPPDEALTILRRTGATHLAVCAAQRPTGDPEARDSLSWRLKEGDVPRWLEPLPPSSGEEAFTIYRVRSGLPG